MKEEWKEDKSLKVKEIRELQERKQRPSMGNFYLMVLGQIVTVMGSALIRFAFSLYVLDITGRADVFAILYAISCIPVLAAPLGGAVSDRFNRKHLMVFYDFACCGVTLGYLAVMMSGYVSVWPVGIAMVLLGIIGAMETPNGTAAIPLLVEPEKLEGANGIIQAVQSLSGVAAPVLGGILYGYMGIRALVMVSSVAFALAAVMELFLKIPFVKREQTGSMAATIAGDLKDGFRYVAKESFINRLMVIAALLNLVLVPCFIVVCPIVLRVTMKSSDVMYGIGMGLVQAASILGAISIGIFAGKMKVSAMYRWMLISSLLLIPMALAVTPFVLGLGYYPAFFVFMLCMVLIVAVSTMLSVFVITKVQKKTPNEHLGKVMAIIQAVAQCMAPLGQIVYGLAFEWFSAAVYLPLFAACLVMLLISGLAYGMLKGED